MGWSPSLIFMGVLICQNQPPKYIEYVKTNQPPKYIEIVWEYQNNIFYTKNIKLKRDITI